MMGATAWIGRGVGVEAMYRCHYGWSVTVLPSPPLARLDPSPTSLQPSILLRNVSDAGPA
jgi:hypothetical protein